MAVSSRTQVFQLADLYTADLVIGGNESSGKSGAATLSGGPRDDIIVGDEGGVFRQLHVDRNYNIALVVDRSLSMRNALSGDSAGDAEMSRMDILKAAEIKWLQTLARHGDTGSVLNVALISFNQAADKPIEVRGLTTANVGSLIDAVQNLRSEGFTNYEAAFRETAAWFKSLPAASDAESGVQNVTYFKTDGDPSAHYLDDDIRVVDIPDTAILQRSLEAFKPLADISEVHAIGIGDSLHEKYLRHFDNTGGVDPAAYTAVGGPMNMSHRAMYDIDSTEGWKSVHADGGVIRQGAGTSIDVIANYGEDARHDTRATEVHSRAFSVSPERTAHFSFDLTATGLATEDMFGWALQKLQGEDWTTVDSGMQADGHIQTMQVQHGSYRLKLMVHDRTDDAHSVVLNIDDVTMHRYEREYFVAAAGEVDSVAQAADLGLSMEAGLPGVYPLPVGDDVINGGAGNDIIFGDALNTDHLPWSGQAAGEHDGMGMQALRDMLTEAKDRAPSRQELYDYIAVNGEQLQRGDDTRGGKDVIDGGDDDDHIHAQGGDDTIRGGRGSDLLSGGTGNDTFVWKLGDEGSEDDPAVDVVTDFSVGGAQGRDVLDLRGLLVDLDKEADLTRYLNVSTQSGESGTMGTFINASSRGQANTGFDQQIFLQGIDLTSGGKLSDDEVIKDLLQKGNLQVYTEIHA